MINIKHDWNQLANYLDIHESVLKRYEPHMVKPTRYTLNRHNQEYLELKALFQLITHRQKKITVSIEKDIEIKTLTPSKGRKMGREMARLDSYTYVAYDTECIIRYCSPHDNQFDKQADHHDYHHKHDFRSGEAEVKKMGNDWPHVSEFLEEVMEL